MVQHMTTSLFSKIDVHSLVVISTKRVLQVVSLWSDLTPADRQWVFQRLNVYCIVAALGWPAATAACASSTATTDFVLPPGVVLPQREQWIPRMQRGQNPQQQPAAVAAPALAPDPALAPTPEAPRQGRGGQRQNRNQGRGGRGGGRK